MNLGKSRKIFLCHFWLLLTFFSLAVKPLPECGACPNPRNAFNYHNYNNTTNAKTATLTTIASYATTTTSTTTTTTEKVYSYNWDHLNSQTFQIVTSFTDELRRLDLNAVSNLLAIDDAWNRHRKQGCHLIFLKLFTRSKFVWPFFECWCKFKAFFYKYFKKF